MSKQNKMLTVCFYVVFYIVITISIMGFLIDLCFLTDNYDNNLFLM